MLVPKTSYSWLLTRQPDPPWPAVPFAIWCAVQAAGKPEVVRAAVTAADNSGQGCLTSEQLEQGLAAAALKFTRHQVKRAHIGYAV